MFWYLNNLNFVVITYNFFSFAGVNKMSESDGSSDVSKAVYACHTEA